MNLHKIIISKFRNNLKNEHFSEILSGSILSFSLKIITVLLGFISNYIIVKYYGSEILGTLALLMSVVTIGSVFGLLGVDVAILRFIPPLIIKKQNAHIFSVLKQSLLMVLVLGIIVSFIVLIASGMIAKFGLRKPELSLLISLISFFILFKVLGKFSIASIRAFKNIKLFVILQGLPSILNITLLVVSTFLMYNIYNPIYSQFVSQFIIVLVSLWFFKKYFFQYKENDNQSILSFKSFLIVSLPMFLTVVIQMIILQTDILMLGSLSTLKNVGIYSIVMKLSMLSAFIINSINTIIAPKFSELYYSDNFLELSNIAKKTTKLIFYATLPITFTLIFFGNYLLSIFGEEFMLGYVALVFLSSGQLINAMSGSVGYFLNMTGHQKSLNLILLIGGISNVIFNIILIPDYGITGAAFASMSSMILWNLLASFYVKRNFGFFIAYIPFVKLK